MPKAQDFFRQLHDDERMHVRRFEWAGLSEDGCDPFTPVSDEPERTGWAATLTEALIKHLELVSERQKVLLRIEILDTRVRALTAKVEELQKAQPVRVTMTTCGPGSFELLKNIEVTIQCLGEEDYVASFFDANVNASGCNANNAFDNLVEAILMRFDTLDNLPPEKLGKGPRRQLAILREFVRRRD